MKKRWYVVHDKYASAPDKRARVWTLSRKHNKPGWCTDSGYPGYGLSHREAIELADAANAAWEAKKRK